MDFLRFLFYLVMNEAGEIKKTGQEKMGNFFSTLAVGLGLAIFSIFGGIFIANRFDVTMGEAVIRIGGFMASILLVLFWVKAMILVRLYVMVFQGGHKLSEKIPDVDERRADKLVQWLRIVIGWLVFAIWYSMLLPVYTRPMAYIIALTAVFVMAFIKNADDAAIELDVRDRLAGIPTPVPPKSKMRRIAFTVTMGVFCWVSLLFISPTTADSLMLTAGHYGQSLVTIGSRSRQLGEVEKRHETTLTSLDAQTLDSLRIEQESLRQSALQNTDRRLDSARQARYEYLEERIQRLKAGDYAKSEAALANAMPWYRRAIAWVGAESWFWPAPKGQRSKEQLKKMLDDAYSGN
ncbi:hypothetical protein A3C96_02550 [Candidatus Uhrbacteria bacterium RIFCSPHIGHO2_02_FULL_60_10]|uniref:Uncharacterized protein n=1 Tax=Candidatus Uhrbacteria bacterium RIFCSPHIGHO2_02_FULL_60_10 TaxID=1802392 RepID=A0A1F7U4F0_9BACT|nr:MAG: hypothetical protein A3C96_02550 [Candidatus Uhrbacteria bacterium RIFCSPHIGHO2_02_FULL_60_10]